MPNATPRNRRPNGHEIHDPASAGEAHCPYCGQPVSRKEFKEIQLRIEMEERARIAKIEADLKGRVARQVAKAQTEAKTAIEKARKDALKAAEARLEAAVTARITAERDAAAKRLADALNSERLAHSAEKLRLETALGDMQRKLAAKTPHQLGEPAEVDLYQTLTEAFPLDRITRVRKGARGADVVIEVVDQNEVIGKIVLDSKVHSRWSNGFTRKLHADQLAIGAEFGVLVSSVFPAGKSELHLQDGVVVVSPARAVAMIELLRLQIAAIHRLRVTGEARSEIAEELLQWILSPEANDLFEALRKSAAAATDLDVAEVEQHQRTWRRRGELIRAVQKCHEDLLTTIEGMIRRRGRLNSRDEEAAE